VEKTGDKMKKHIQVMLREFNVAGRSKIALAIEDELSKTGRKRELFYRVCKVYGLKDIGKMWARFKELNG
jgi:hypothetical protein